MKAFKKILAVALVAVMAMTMLTACGITKADVVSAIDSAVKEKNITITHSTNLDTLIDKAYNKVTEKVNLWTVVTNSSSLETTVKDQFSDTELKKLAEEVGVDTSASYDYAFGLVSTGAEAAKLVTDKLTSSTTYNTYGVKVMDLPLTSTKVVLVIVSTGTK